jgi:hypothetical protein
VCLFGAVTGNELIDYLFTNKDGGDSTIVTSANCDPTAGTSSSTPKALFFIHETKLVLPDDVITIDSEIGGQTFGPGTYYSSSLTMATNTKVTLKGTGEFRFIAGSTMVTGANTEVVLVNGDPILSGAVDAAPTSDRIEWVVTAAATIGALSDLKGSVLAGAAITLGEKAKVSGRVLALAAITLGADCDINNDLVN